MKIRKFAILATATLPLLAMCNYSPTPEYREVEQYTQYEINNFSLVDFDDRYLYYRFDITNTGQGLLSLGTIGATDQLSQPGHINEFLVPNETETIDFSAYQWQDDYGMTKSNIVIFGYDTQYIKNDVLKISSVSEITKAKYGQNKYFTYTFEIDYRSNNDQYTGHYVMIAKIRDKSTGKLYYFRTSNLISKEQYFTSYRDLDPNNLEVESYLYIHGDEYWSNKAVRERELQSLNFNLKLNALVVLFFVILFMAITIPISGGIFLIIFFSVRHARKVKSKKEKENNNNNINT